MQCGKGFPSAGATNKSGPGSQLRFIVITGFLALSHAVCLAASGIYVPTPLDIQPATITPALSGKVSSTIDADCNRKTGTNINCKIGNAPDTTDNTPYFSEIITEQTPAGQRSWYHIIIGEQGQDFAQEMYIKRGGPGSLSSKIDGFLHCNGVCDSHSGGAWGDINANHTGIGTLNNLGGNGLNPLGPDSKITGTGSGNPESVLMKTVLKGVGYQEEYVKSEFSRKPVIKQDLTNATFNMNSQIDMSNTSYRQGGTAGAVTINQGFSDPSLSTAADFHSASDIDPANAHVTAGRYVFEETPTRQVWMDYTGTANSPECLDPLTRAQMNATLAPSGITWCRQVNIASDSGSRYVYTDGQGFDPRQVDWMSYRDPLQNPFAADKHSYITP